MNQGIERTLKYKGGESVIPCKEVVMVDSFIFGIKAYGRNCRWQVLWILYEVKKGKNDVRIKI